MKKLPAVLLAGIASFALGAMMFAGDKPVSPTPQGRGDAAPGEAPLREDARRDEARPAYLLAQKESAAGSTKAAAPDLGWIGLMLEEDKEKGLRVANVFPGGPAAFAGIRTGDVLLKVGATTPDSISQAVEAIEKLAQKKPATLAVRRNGKTLELTVNVGSLTEFHERYVREMLRRDPRDANFTQHHGVSEADMSVELVRRMFEQNQRLESTLHDVLTELQSLRSELRERKK